MILATSLFNELSKMLGVPSIVVEGGVVGLLAFVLVYLVIILRDKEKEDVKQLALSTQLVGLFGKSLEGFEALKSAIEENSEVLRTVKEAFESVTLHINNQVAPIAISLEQVRKELISNKSTRVVIKDSSGTTVAELHAEPTVDDSGEQYLVVQYDLKEIPDGSTDSPAVP